MESAAVKPQEAILSACCTLNFGPEQRERVRSASRGNIDWRSIASAAVAHKIAPLVFQNLKRCEDHTGPIPADVWANLRQSAMRCGARNLRFGSNIAFVAAYFHAHAHDVLVLKHASYFFAHRPLFDLTMADDLDLAARPVAEANETFDAPYRWSSNGIPDSTWAVIDGLVDRKDPRLGPLRLEIDNRLHHDIVWNGVIPVDFRRVWADATVYHIDGQAVHVPRVDDLIIISAINIFRKPFVRLRNLLEIREIIQLQPAFDWDALAKKSRAYTCGSIVHSALATVRATLGWNVDARLWKDLRTAPLRARAINHFSSRACSPSTDGRSSQIANLVRRGLAFDARQVARFIWFRLILRRVARAIKY
jgi:hypothetical protein